MTVKLGACTAAGMVGSTQDSTSNTISWPVQNNTAPDNVEYQLSILPRSSYRAARLSKDLLCERTGDQEWSRNLLEC